MSNESIKTLIDSITESVQELEQKYSPDQPRDADGKFGSGGGGGLASALGQSKPSYKVEGSTLINPDGSRYTYRSAAEAEQTRSVLSGDKMRQDIANARAKQPMGPKMKAPKQIVSEQQKLSQETAWMEENSKDSTLKNPKGKYSRMMARMKEIRDNYTFDQ
jgi:hypothetical protein